MASCMLRAVGHGWEWISSRREPPPRRAGPGRTDQPQQSGGLQGGMTGPPGPPVWGKQGGGAEGPPVTRSTRFSTPKLTLVTVVKLHACSVPWDTSGSGLRPDVNPLPVTPDPGGLTGPSNQEDCGGGPTGPPGPPAWGKKGGGAEGPSVTRATREHCPDKGITELPPRGAPQVVEHTLTARQQRPQVPQLCLFLRCSF